MWGKLDDKLHSNPKMIRAGYAAIGARDVLVSYSNDYLTDGFIEHAVARRFLDGELVKHPLRDELVPLLDWMVECEILHAVPDRGGFVIHDFHVYSFTREQVLAERAKKVAAGRAGGKKSGETRAKKTGETPAPRKAEVEAPASTPAQAETNPDPDPGPGPSRPGPETKLQRPARRSARPMRAEPAAVVAIADALPRAITAAKSADAPPAREGPQLARTRPQRQCPENLPLFQPPPWMQSAVGDGGPSP